MLRSEPMSCFKIQSANESVENIMFTLGNENLLHFENLNSSLKDDKPFMSNLLRCKELETKIKELKEIIYSCGSRAFFGFLSRVCLVKFFSSF